MSLLDNLPHKCDITVRTTVVGDMGGERETWTTTSYKDEPCWVQNATAAEIEDWEKRGHAISHKVYFNRDLALTHRNRLDVGEFRVVVQRPGRFPEQRGPRLRYHR